MNHVPTDLAAAAVGVVPATIRKWVERGKLTRYPDGFDLAELAECADSRDLDALLSKAGIALADRPACHLRTP
jgi:hypothetical protein